MGTRQEKKGVSLGGRASDFVPNLWGYSVHTMSVRLILQTIPASLKEGPSNGERSFVWLRGDYL